MVETPIETNKAEDGIARERSVLLIENNDTQLKVCRNAILSQSPLYGVKAITTGGEAAKMMETNFVDIVVMDYDVPDMSGDDLIRTIHQINPNCPIIAMTGADSPDKALKVLMAGASDYLPKTGEYYKFLPRMITTNIQRALLLENLRDMYQRVERISRDEALLNRLIVNIHGSLDLAEIIDRAAQSLSDEFGVSRAIICLSSDPTSAMRIARQVARPEASPISEKSILFQRYHDVLLDVGERRPLVVMQDDTFPFATDVKSDLIHHGILSMIMVPLVYRGRLLGLVHLDQVNEPRLFTQAEISLLSRIANQMSIAISQARLYQIVETQSTSIDKLTDLCSQLNSVVNSTRELTERQESREKVRVKLSTREIEVLRKVAQGLSNREIAEALHITEGTTEVHVSRLRKKLTLSSRAALVRYAYENHLC